MQAQHVDLVHPVNPLDIDAEIAGALRDLVETEARTQANENTDDDDDDDPMTANEQLPGRGWRPLHRFLRLAQSTQTAFDIAYPTNDQLVAALVQNGTIQSDDVARAMRVCSRAAFAPEAHAAEALKDQPLHLPDLGFNISAPHMHATCLSALALKPGHRFLDVGCGCGVLVACAAMLTGPGGAAVGIDIKECAVELSRTNLDRLEAKGREFADSSPTTVFGHNVFVPSPLLRGQFDRVHVGATCPPSRLAALTKLLGREGGMIVTPVDSELRLITVSKDGTISQKCLSRVRYSDLVVPQDCEAVRQVVEAAQAMRTCLLPPPSTFASDAADVMRSSFPNSPCGFNSPGIDSNSETWQNPGESGRIAAIPYSTNGPPHSMHSMLSSGSKHSAFGTGSDSQGRCFGTSSSSSSSSSRSSNSSSGEGSPWVPASMKRIGRMLSGWGPPTLEHHVQDMGGSPPLAHSPWSKMSHRSSSMSEATTELGEELLGLADAQLAGQGWSLPVHQVVMQSRCELWRLRASIGMSDAGAVVLMVPDATPQPAAAALVTYCKTDTLPVASMDAQGLNHLVAVLHLALYFGCARLVAMAEAQLAAALLAPPTSDFDPSEAAPALLALADDCNLDGLTTAALDYCVHHHEEVAETGAYKALSQRQYELLARAACAEVGRYKAALQEVGDKTQLPEPERSRATYLF